jgi:hypothetical protein
MLNVYCPVCHISSPREVRELMHPRTFCTVCGATLNKSLVEAAVARRTEPGVASTQTVEGRKVADGATLEKSEE